MMKRLLLAILAIAMFISPLSAVEFKDVPPNHWAQDAIEKIVKYGVTQGYPDGTFRGTRTINRYELSVFLANLIQSMEERIQKETADIQNGASQKAVQELRSELADLKAQVENVQTPGSAGNGFKVDLSYAARARYNDLLNDTEASTKYENRFKVDAFKQLADNTAVRIKYDSQYVDITAADMLANLDLLDAIFTTAVDLGLENPIKIALTTGPGRNIDVYNHYDDAIIFSTELYGLDLGYEHSVDYDIVSLGYILPDFGLGVIELEGTGELYNEDANPFAETDTRKVKALFTGKTSPSAIVDTLELSGLLGLNLTGEDKLARSKTAVQAKAELGDVFNVGQTYTAMFTKTGSNFYIDYNPLAGATEEPTNETTIRRLFKNLIVPNSKTVYEFEVTQSLPNEFLTSIYAGFMNEGAGLFEDLDAEYCLTLSRDLECSNVLIDVDTPVTWFVNLYKKYETDNTTTDFVRSGLVFNF